MKSLFYLSAFFGTLMVMGCHNCSHYDTVPNGKNRVVFARPGAAFTRNQGGTMNGKVLEPGKWNHGNGVIIGYDIEITEQQLPITMHLTTKDQLVEEYQLVVQYAVLPGEACKDLVLNYLDPNLLKYENGDPLLPPHTSNELRIVPVDPDIAFAQICQPIIEEVAFRLRGQYSDITKEDLQVVLNEEFRRKIKEIQIQKQVVDQDGRIVFTDQKTTPLDVFSLNQIVVKDRKPAAELQNARDAVEQRKIYYEQLKIRKQRLAVDRQRKMEVAQQMAARNASLNAILRKDPRILVYKRQQEFKEFIEGGLGENVEIIILPEGVPLNTRQ